MIINDKPRSMTGIAAASTAAATAAAAAAAALFVRSAVSGSFAVHAVAIAGEPGRIERPAAPSAPQLLAGRLLESFSGRSEPAAEQQLHDRLCQHGAVQHGKRSEQRLGHGGGRGRRRFRGRRPSGRGRRRR